MIIYFYSRKTQGNCGLECKALIFAEARLSTTGGHSILLPLAYRAVQLSLSPHKIQERKWRSTMSSTTIIRAMSSKPTSVRKRSCSSKLSRRTELCHPTRYCKRSTPLSILEMEGNWTPYAVVQPTTPSKCLSISIRSFACMLNYASSSRCGIRTGPPTVI